MIFVIYLPFLVAFVTLLFVVGDSGQTDDESCFTDSDIFYKRAALLRLLDFRGKIGGNIEFVILSISKADCG